MNEIEQKPLYQQIREDLMLSYRETGDVRVPPEREICKKYNVCRPTVHKALSYLVENGMVIRRQGKGSFFRLPQEKKNSIAGIKLVIRKDWKVWSGDIYFGQTVQGICSALNGTGIHLTIEQFSDQLLLNLLGDHSTASIWLSPEKQELEAVKTLADVGCPVVTLNRIPRQPGINFVSGNHIADGELAGRYINEKKVSQVYFIISESDSGLTESREEGLRRVLDSRISYQCIALNPLDIANEMMLAKEKYRIGDEAFVLINSETFLKQALHIFPNRERMLFFADSTEPLRYRVALIAQPIAEIGRLAGEIVGKGDTSLSGSLVPGTLYTC